MEKRHFLMLGLLGLLAGGNWWLIQQGDQQQAPRENRERSPDYYLDNFANTTMGPEGQPQYRLVAERMLHYDDDLSTELTRPVLTLFKPGMPPWRAKSETGWVSSDGELVLLQGRVNIDREAAPGVRPLHLVTRELRVQPKEEYAETDQPVEAHSYQDWVKSVGMEAWLGEPMRVKLLSRVRAHHEVN